MSLKFSIFRTRIIKKFLIVSLGCIIAFLVGGIFGFLSLVIRIEEGGLKYLIQLSSFRQFCKNLMKILKIWPRKIIKIDNLLFRNILNNHC